MNFIHVIRLGMPVFLAIVFTMLFVGSSVVLADKPDNSDKTSQERALKQVAHDIEYLASDELGGRQPGTPGIKLAEDFIVEEYKKAGLKAPYENGSYFQEMEVGNQRFVVKEKSVLSFKGPEGKELNLDLGDNFVSLIGRKGYQLEKPVVFVGYGINAEDDLNYDELSPVDVKDKIVVIIRREPQQGDENSVFDGTDVSKHAYIRTKINNLRSAGVAGVIMVNDGFSVTEDDDLVEADQFGTSTSRLPFVHVKRDVVDQLLAETPIVQADGSQLSKLSEIEAAIDQTLEPLSQTLEGWTVTMEADFQKKAVKTNNIIGVIEGEGPHADETIIIGGHYDHLGMGAYGSRAPGRKEIHNGADDNATGTAAVIELARRFAQRETKPARRLVFICFTAEEMGLLGARHYVENPLYPLDKTVAMINFDMIGWLRNGELTVFNWNSSEAFEPVLDKANESFQLNLKKPRSGFAGSDHLPFFQRDIPVMFLHTGLTSTYHTPEDDFETLDCVGALKVIDYTEHVVDGIAELETAPVFGVPAAPARIRLGIVLVNDREAKTVTIESVNENSIARRSGLQPGDVIVGIGDEVITSRRQVTRAIRRDTGNTIKMKVKRDDVELTLNVTLKEEDTQ